ncbi:VanZ family protein [Vibrio maerlii]|uniref:VanZ family protein n=1 Tax=Vibrio maerlii TaxID=2231648 RepID=UPI000E3C3116|nr:VanZ family protein [Vibrio maerlii]
MQKLKPEATALLNRRTLILLVLVLAGGLASMAKTFGVYGNLVRETELFLGGDWALHAVLSTCLGLVASWATPPQWLNRPFFMVSPITLVILAMVILDESLQAFSPLREFSFEDMSINIAGVWFGTLCYLLWIRLFCSEKKGGVTPQ